MKNIIRKCDFFSESFYSICEKIGFYFFSRNLLQIQEKVADEKRTEYW